VSAYLADLERRYSQAKGYVGHLRRVLADHVDHGDPQSRARRTNLERDLKEAEIDAGRLEGLIAAHDKAAA
jgi:hypothetical protein